MANTEALIMESLRWAANCAKNLPGRGRGNAWRGRDGNHGRDNQTPWDRDGSGATDESSKERATDLALEEGEGPCERGGGSAAADCPSVEPVLKGGRCCTACGRSPLWLCWK